MLQAYHGSPARTISGMNLKLQACADLFGRYGAIFRHAWHERKQFDTQPRLAHEAQFLPAALELQETPVSPAPRVAMWLLIAFAIIALLWAVFGHMDVVATAHGRIVPSDRTKVIQPFDTATVKAIHVIDGQAVKAGEVLVELDATSTAADTTRIANDLLTARLQAARARAMLNALASGRLPVLERISDVAADRWPRSAASSTASMASTKPSSRVLTPTLRNGRQNSPRRGRS